MFVLPGLLALVIFIYVRPFDFVPALAGMPFLYIFFGLALFGFIVDLRQGNSQIRLPPHGIWVIAFYAWCLLTATVKGPERLGQTGLHLTIALTVYSIIALGLPSFKAFESLAATILACTIVISAICVHEGLQPSQCVGMLPEEDSSSPGHPDGRPCTVPAECIENAPERFDSYRCEHIGVAGITSISGRVRYVGVLQDPNEVAMTVAIGIPLALALYQRKRTLFRFLVAAATFLLATTVAVMSKSRGGQLVFLAVLGVYFLKRFRSRGLLVALVAALPVLLLGGRSSTEADASALERAENLIVGIEMFVHSPVLGVGYGNFTQHHFLTAHNSYVLAPAELGIPGMIAWLSILGASLKTTFRTSALAVGPEGEVARIWGLALLSAFVGLSCGIFFLSFNYHFVFWIYTGMVGALAAAVARHLRTFRTDLVVKEVGLITLGAMILLLVIFAYATHKLRFA